MSIKLRGGTWHCDFVAPDGSRVRRSLKISDKRQAQEFHDRLKAEAWRVKKSRGITEKAIQGSLHTVAA